jgi:glutamyl-tRNA(Gln) amidotransferase subunit D
MVEKILDEHRGLVIAGTGLGHVPGEIIETVRKNVNAGKPVVITTQCIYGTVDMEVYSSGRRLLQAGAIPGGDMLPETALIKLMWVLGKTTKMSEIRELMQTDLVGEIGARRLVEISPGPFPDPEGKEK